MQTKLPSKCDKSSVAARKLNAMGSQTIIDQIEILPVPGLKTPRDSRVKDTSVTPAKSIDSQLPTTYVTTYSLLSDFRFFLCIGKGFETSNVKCHHFSNIILASLIKNSVLVRFK